MRNIMSLAVFLLFAFVFVNFVPAQDLPKAINGGVLNGKAVSLPRPAYPAEARERKAQGAVAIKVTVDEEGNVIEANPVPLSSVTKKSEDGAVEEVTEKHADEALVQAALEAAWQAKFSPTRLSGVPVKVTGVITYNFTFTETDLTKHINGGVLNGKAISLPAPEYPAAGKAVRASGTVSVQVLIDEGGNIIAASAVSGHPLLRAAAVQAAREAKFNPTYLSGAAVKVSGVITYNFVLPDVGQN